MNDRKGKERRKLLVVTIHSTTIRPSFPFPVLSFPVGNHMLLATASHLSAHTFTHNWNTCVICFTHSEELGIATMLEPKLNIRAEWTQRRSYKYDLLADKSWVYYDNNARTKLKQTS